VKWGVFVAIERYREWLNWVLDVVKYKLWESEWEKYLFIELNCSYSVFYMRIVFDIFGVKIVAMRRVYCDVK
jgi:hypothetical protein